MTLNEVMKETADAIREKTGKSELIAPVDFAEEIKSISVGGGESGGSTIEYLDMTNVAPEPWMSFLLTMSLFVKQQITPPSGVPTNSVLPIFLSYSMQGNLLGVNQFAIDFKATIVLGADGNVMTATVADFLIQQGATQEKLDAIPRITKEQFYDLNA